MDRKNTQDYQMLTQVLDCGTKNVSWFPNHTAAPEILAALATVVTKLTGLASAQVSAATTLRTTRSARLAAREALRARLQSLELTARALNNETLQAPRK